MSDQRSSGDTPLAAAPLPPPDDARHRRRARIALLAAVIVAAGGGGYSIAQFTAHSSGHAQNGHNRSAGGTGASGAGGTGGPAGSSAGFSSSPLAQSIARQAGTRLRGTAPQTVSTSQVRTLGDQVPAGASVDKAADKITFIRATVSFIVVAIPPGGPDMTFRVAGLTNPNIVVPQGSQVTVEFINADTDEAHGWLVTNQQPPFNFGQSRQPAISGGSAGLIGDPTTAGDGARTVTFRADPTGTYQYICPMPGHAQMGMHGTFIVR